MTAATKRGRGPGRPPLPNGAAKGAVLSLRVTAGERSAIGAAARAAGLSASEWARAVIVAAAKPT